jgi:hypothetical protein
MEPGVAILRYGAEKNHQSPAWGWWYKFSYTALREEFFSLGPLIVWLSAYQKGLVGQPMDLGVANPRYGTNNYNHLPIMRETVQNSCTISLESLSLLLYLSGYVCLWSKRMKELCAWTWVSRFFGTGLERRFETLSWGYKDELLALCQKGLDLAVYELGRRGHQSAAGLKLLRAVPNELTNPWFWRTMCRCVDVELDEMRWDDGLR